MIPGDAAAFHDQAMLLYQQGLPDHAIDALRRASALDPSRADILNDLGVILDERGDREEAVRVYDQVLALRPAYAEAMNNRAVALHLLGRLPEALAQWDAAVAVSPGYADAWLNRGEVLTHLDRLDEALVSYAQVAALLPDDPRPLVNAAIALMHNGRYAEGLPLYEHRWRGALKDAAPQLPRPLWLGETPIDGRTVLVHAEQGLGDTLLGLRFIPVLADRGAKVIVTVQGPLETLAAEVRGVEAVIPYGEPLPPYDVHIPMMSLPLALEVGLDTVPGAPYLRAPDDARARWRERLGPARRPRIGIAWSGSTAYTNDFRRSIPLALMAPLFGLDADFYALQLDCRPSDSAAFDASPIIDLTPQFTDFADTAAVVEQMDLVISVCTAASNLTGALGKPLFVLLGAPADWRWTLKDDRSPWYPSARLFRQQFPGDWPPVIERVREAAEAFLS